MSIKTKTIIGKSMTAVKEQVKEFMEQNKNKIGTIKGIDPFYDEGNHIGVAIRYELKEVAE